MNFNKERILDESNISFKIENGKIQVFDQFDKLIGEKTFPVPITPNMSIEEIYDISSKCGFNLDNTIYQIINQTVIIEKKYDVWISENKITYFSGNDWVSQPCDGFFSQIKESLLTELYGDKHFHNEQNRPVNNNNEQEQVIEEYKNVISNVPEYEEEEEDEDVFTLEFSFNNENEQPEVIEEEITKIEEEPEYEEIDGKEIPYTEKDYLLDNSPEESSLFEEDQDDKVVDFKEENEMDYSKMLQKEKKIFKWVKAYEKMLKDNKEHNDLKISDIATEVSKIILEKNVDVFDIDDRDVLMELIKHFEVLFEVETALYAGFLMAYFQQKNEDLTE